MAQPETRADVTLVVVHGIGQQLRGETLLEWVEPLQRRLEKLSLEHGGRGARIRSSTILEGDDSEIWLDVETAAEQRRTIRFVEARWADSFLTFSYLRVLWWAAFFTPRLTWRVVKHLFRSYRLAFRSIRQSDTSTPPLDRLDQLVQGRAAAVTRETGRFARLKSLGLNVLAFWVLLIFVAPALGTIAIVLIALVLIPTVVITMLVLIVLASIPVIGPKVRPLILAITSTVGDADVWVTSPIRAAAMRDVVRSHVRAAYLISDEVVVLAHSQGAAISVSAVFDSFDSDATTVDALLTVGAAVTLLKRPSHPGRNQVGPAALWAGTSSRWVNFWATFDPVPAGPIADSERRVTERWLEAYEANPRVQRIIDQLVEEEVATLPPVVDPNNIGVVIGAALEEAAAINASPEALAEYQRKQKAARDSAKPSVAGVVGEFALLFAGPTSKSIAEEAREREVEAVRARVTAEVRKKLARAKPNFFGPIGPEERVVHNRASLVFDHGLYSSNVLQVLDPVARILLGPKFEKEERDPSVAADVDRYVHTVMELTSLRLFSLALSILAAPIVLSWIQLTSVLDFSWDYVAKLGDTWAAIASLFRDTAGIGVAYLVLSGIAVYVVVMAIGTGLWRLNSSAFTSATSSAGRWARALPFKVYRGIVLAAAYGGFLASVGAVIWTDPPFLLLGEFVGGVLLYGYASQLSVPATVPARRMEKSHKVEEQKGAGRSVARRSRPTHPKPVPGP